MSWLWDACVLTLGIAIGVVLMPYLGHISDDVAIYTLILAGTLLYSARDLTDPEEHDQP